tara:strand:- start:304 stop:810 length:507 start_codon:yes stop_codon:yes gene_type:complete
MPNNSPKILITDLPPLPLLTNVENVDKEEWFVKTVKFVRRNLRGEASGHYNVDKMESLCKELCEIWPEPLDFYTPEDIERIEEFAKSKKKGHFYKFCRAIESSKNNEIHDILEEWLFDSVKDRFKEDVAEGVVHPLGVDWDCSEGLMVANDERTVVSLRMEIKSNGES